MGDKIIINPQPITPYKPTAGANQQAKVKSAEKFGSAMAEAIRKNSGVTFSAHAVERLQQRNVNLVDEQLQKIEDAMVRARSKGVNSSLVLLGDIALVASVKNNTIITALDKSGMKDHVFTGIDGAVIID